MEIKIKELGEIVVDNVTDQDGMLTTVSIGMDRNKRYVFQPSLINPKTGQPVERFYLDEARIEKGNDIRVDLPLEVLGTIVEDKATGFKGTAIELDLHINGCVHFGVKPKGVIKESNKAIDMMDFDIRRLKGKMIKEMTKEEKLESHKKTPSPEHKPTSNIAS